MKFLFALLATALALAPAVQAQEDLASTTLTKVGQIAPDFTAESLAGGKVSLSSYRGHVVVVSFFATWCPPCRAELPHLEKDVWTALKDQGLVVLAVDREEPRAKVEPFVKAKGFTFPVLLDVDRAVYAKYASNYIPRLYVIDREGRIAFQTVGYDDAEFPGVLAKIKAALASKP